MTANPWIFGLEAVQLGWQAQIALTLKLMRSFAGSVPDQISSSPTRLGIVDDAKGQENVVAFAPASAPTIDEPKAPAANPDNRRRKATKVLPAFKKLSMKTCKKTSRPKAVKNSARKSSRRSTSKPR
jgi:hypothetical protein